MPRVVIVDDDITYRVQEKVNARAHAEFFKQSGDVKLHRSLRKMQPCSDLLVSEVLCYVVENFTLPVTQGRAVVLLGVDEGSDQFCGPAGQSFGYILTSLDHHNELARGLVPGEALYGQEACGLVYRHAAVVVRFHLESPGACFLVEKYKESRMHLEPS